MTDPRQQPDPRQQSGINRNDDPNLGQKEAEEEKAEIEQEDEDTQDDELEPMERPPEQQSQS